MQKNNETDRKSKYEIIYEKIKNASFKDFCLFLALIISISSAYFAFQANEHTKVVEEANLQIGHVKFTNNSLFISLINGYYSRYPAYITNGEICFMDNCQKMDISSEGEWKLVERDEPNILTMKFDQLFLKDIEDGDYKVNIKIGYIDFGEMYKKSITSKFEVVVINHNITKSDLIDIKRNKIEPI